jgi:chromosome segregation ATPase
MTAKRDVDSAPDTLAWLHGELSQMKSRLALMQSQVEQGAGLASDAAEKAHSFSDRLGRLEALAAALGQLQEDSRQAKEQLLRLHSDLVGLRQAQDESAKRSLAASEKAREERNETSQTFADVRRQLDAWSERSANLEEQHRRAVEAAAQLSLKVQALEAERDAQAARHTRMQALVSHLDEESNRLSSLSEALRRADEGLSERAQSANEALRRLEGELDGLKAQVNRIDRIDDRLELVQAERSRHGERLTELTLQLERLETGQAELAERATLIEARMTGYQEELAGLAEELARFRDQVGAHFRAVAAMEAEFRKREIIALQKETREIRSRDTRFADE